MGGILENIFSVIIIAIVCYSLYYYPFSAFGIIFILIVGVIIEEIL